MHLLELYLDGVMMLLSPTTTITPPEVGYCASPTTVRAQVPRVRAAEQSMHTADGAHGRTMCAAVRGARATWFRLWNVLTHKLTMGRCQPSDRGERDREGV